MPTTRRRRLRKRTEITLDSITNIFDVMALVCGWRPPISDLELERARWRTWDQFFGAFDAVQCELEQSMFMRLLLPEGGVPFAARIRGELRARPGSCYDAHRHAAYQHEHIYRFSDGHAHAEMARLGAAIEVRAASAGHADGATPPAAAVLL